MIEDQTGSSEESGAVSPQVATVTMRWALGATHNPRYDKNYKRHCACTKVTEKFKEKKTHTQRSKGDPPCASEGACLINSLVVDKSLLSGVFL